MTHRLNTFGLNRLAEFGPDSLPRLLTEHLPGDNSIGLHFNATCFSGVHVTSTSQALIEVLLMHASFYSEAPALPRGDFYVHTPYLSDSLAYGQAFRTKPTARNVSMETNAERRRRKLADLCATHGLKAVAERSGLSAPSLDQIIKKVLLPPKKDGSRTARSLGDDAARRIEDAEGLGRGWFDVADQPRAVNVAPASMGAARVPIISSVQAGAWCGVEEPQHAGNDGEWLGTDYPVSKSAFALEVKGVSMQPEFQPGDHIIIDPTVQPRPGDFVVAKNGEEEATFKKYRPRGVDASGQAVFELVALNEDYPSMRSDVTPMRVIGTMVEHRKYRPR
jgi:SOS-response transcriptional repressor LexA